MIALAGRISNHHRAPVLPRDIRKETSIFQATWINRISTAAQLGTANMVYHISRMSRTSGRICKAQYSEALNSHNLPMGPQPTAPPDEPEGDSETESEPEAETTTNSGRTSADEGLNHAGHSALCPTHTAGAAAACGGRIPRGASIHVRGPLPNPQKQDQKAGNSP